MSTIEEEILKELAEIKSLVIANKKVLNADEAALFLGIPKGSLYKLTSQGKIPHSKPTNGILYFDRDEITEWTLGAKVVDAKKEAQKYLHR